jgi:hypothetical protein
LFFQDSGNESADTTGDARVVQIEFALGDFDETPIAAAEDQAKAEKDAENKGEVVTEEEEVNKNYLA